MMYFMQWHGIALPYGPSRTRSWLLLGLWGAGTVEKWIAEMQQQRGSIVHRYSVRPFVVTVRPAESR